MKKGLIIIGVLIIVTVGYLIISFRDTKTKNPVATNSQIEPTSITVKDLTPKLKEYQDESGFKFKYPEEFNVLTKANLDKSTYASLLITTSKYQGKLTVVAVDSDLNKVDDWFQGNKSVSEIKNIKDIKLDVIDAKQFQENDRIVTLALDQGVLFTFTTTPINNNNAWINLNNQVLKSFTFALPQSNPVTDNSNESNNDIVYEGEEEIIE